MRNLVITGVDVGTRIESATVTIQLSANNEASGTLIEHVTTGLVPIGAFLKSAKPSIVGLYGMFDPPTDRTRSLLNRLIKITLWEEECIARKVPIVRVGMPCQSPDLNSEMSSDKRAAAAALYLVTIMRNLTRATDKDSNQCSLTPQ